MDLSFEWAKSGSWEEYERELDKVLKSAAAIAPVPTGQPATGLPTPPVTPEPGILDKAKSFGSGLMDQASGMWGKMPTWGQGALIGGGIGALGGMLTDKKKTRGLLQGGLVGAGLGGLGGLAYNQISGGGSQANKPLDYSGIEKAKPAQTGNMLQDKIVAPIAAGADAAAGSPYAMAAGTAIGGYVGGKALYSAGNKNAVPFLGADSSPKAGPTLERPTQYIRPTDTQVMENLRRSEGALQPTVETLARKQINPDFVTGRPGQNTGASGVPLELSHEQLREAMNRLNYASGKPPASYDLPVGGNRINVTNKDLINERIAQLEHGAEGAHIKMKSPTVMGMNRNAANSLLRGAGKFTQIATAGLGGLQALGVGSRNTDVPAALNNLPFSQETLPTIVKGLQSADPTKAHVWLDNATIPLADKDNIRRLLQSR